ncbi:GtrA family protein [Cellulomonas sp. P22]|uniref:GtrA family protein n=1 Tax=Cellulomonas sp. P22 TaxID=3373189 RepID=UPI0037B2DA84
MDTTVEIGPLGDGWTTLPADPPRPTLSVARYVPRTPLGRRAVARLRRTELLDQLVRFGLVGAVMTASYIVIYLALTAPIGAQTANFVALFATAVANTAVNRRVTFGVRGRRRAAAQHGQGLLIFALSWALTSGSLAVLDALAPGAPHTVELAALVVSNLGATLVRFVLLRQWVFRPARSHDA